MKNLKINKNILILLFITFLVKLLFLIFFLGPHPTILAPDEATFSSLIHWVSIGNLPSTFPLTGGDLFFTSLSFTLPSLVLVKVGFNTLFAARLITIIYSLLSIFLIYKILCSLSNKTFFNYPLKKRDVKMLYAIILIFTYFPSSFLWTSLALRESANHFYTLLVFFSIIQYIKEFSLRHLIFYSLSLIFLYFSRPEVLLILCFSTLSLIYYLKSKVSYIFIIILPIFIFLISSRVEIFLYNQTNLNILKNEQSVLIPSENNVTVSVSTASENNGTSFGADQIKKINKIFDEFKELRINKRKGAVSAFPVYKCPDVRIFLFGESVNYCLIYNLPKQFVDVVLKPGLNSNNKSWYKNFAGIENYLFNLLLILATILYFRYKNINELTKVMLTFISSFIIFTLIVLATVEGNYGTSYRHKIIILAPILIMIYSGYLNHQKEQIPQ